MKSVNIKEFGALGDGIADDYIAVQSALDSGAEEVIIPQGIYCISDTLKVHSNTRIIADRTAKLVMKSDKRKKRGDFLLSNADVENGERNIEIIGGIWDGNNTAEQNRKPDLFDENGYSGAILNIVNVDGFTLRDAVIANSVTFYVRMGKLHNFTIENIDFISDNFGENQDGLHFGGDVKHGTVKNIRALSFGQTNDDMIALNADDSIVRVENRDLTRDTIEDIYFENIYCESCHTIIRMLSVTAAIRDIRFKNIYGGFRCHAVNADGARYCRTPLFKEDDHPAGIGKMEDIYFENFVCRPTTCLPEKWKGTPSTVGTAICLESLADNFNIRGFKILPASDGSCITALKARNLVDTVICADDSAYILSEKSDTGVISNAENITINRQK